MNCEENFSKEANVYIGRIASLLFLIYYFLWKMHLLM
jgi:hypothetical protein